MKTRLFTQQGAIWSGAVTRASRTLVLALGLALLVACSGGSGGSHQSASSPTAVATPIGYKPTSAAGASPVLITVRAGADVQLTGEDSSNGNISITGFAWQQTDSAPTPAVSLVYRNSSTVSFTAPYVASSIALNFQLTVTDANGLKGTATVKVSVVPANDPNRFLSLLVAPHAIPTRFRAALSLTTSNTSPGTPITLAADAPVCVKLTPTLTYLNRNAVANSVALPVQQVDAKWLASAGATAGFAANPPAYLAFRNPVVSFDLPVVNDELLFAKYNQPGASTADIANQLVLSDIDSAYVQMAVSASPGSCDGSQSATALAGAQLMMQLQDEAGNAIGPAATGAADAEVSIDTSLNAALSPNPLTPDQSNHLTPQDVLRASSVATANPAIETRESAAAYYAAINPPSAPQKTTLTAWLSQNCFDSNSPTFGAGEAGFNVVHATYTNNFDLGFGRDMYFATCADGNMAAVVVNYPSLEALANRLGAFLAVAMEYTPAAGSSAPCFANPADATTNTGNCFTKFYAFAADDRSGEFKRVLSANFDRRGQKYLPGACTVCHGGTPNFVAGAAGAAYANGPHGAGDVDATFLPWDLGSLLFADQNTPNSDPSFACSVSTTSTACQSINPTLYTLATQEPNIQRLNALAWRTYQFPENVMVAGGPVDRYAAPIALLTKWYGGDPAASAAHKFDDSATPADWPTSPNDAYHQVFAHYCRACHTQNSSPTEQFATYAGFQAFLTPNVSSQLNKSLNVQQLVFSNAQMPLARLTSDRFWADFNGGPSAAQNLATFINAQPNTAPVALDANLQVIPPGQPLIMPVLSSNPSAGTPLLSTGQTLARFQGASLDALTQSLFVSNYQWSLCTVGPPTSPGGACPGSTADLIGTPVVPVSTGGSAGPAQSGASLPALSTSAPGTFYLTLTAGSTIFGAAASSSTFPISIAQQDPVLTAVSNCPSTQANFDGTPVPIDVTDPAFGCFRAQVLGDAPYSLLVSGDGSNYAPCINSTACAGGLNNALFPWTAAVSSGQVLNPATGQNVFVPKISFNFTSAATGAASLFFRWCDGNQGPSSCVSGSALVSLSTGLTVTDTTFLAYWQPTDPNYGQNGFAFSLPPSGLPINPSMSLGALSPGHISIDAPTATITLTAQTRGGTFSSNPLTGTPNSLKTQISNLTYTPGGSFVTCDINGNDLATGSACTGLASDSATFTYKVADTNDAPKTGTGAVNIRALASFQSAGNAIYSTLGTTCATSGCHLAGGGGGTIAWSYTAVTPTTLNGMSTTHSSILSGTDHTTAAAPLVQPGDPTHSAFYTATCMGTDAVNGMAQQFAPAAAQCQTIYQWILEGGQLD